VQLDQAALGLPEVNYLIPELKKRVLPAYRDLIIGAATAIRDAKGATVPRWRIIREADEIIALETRIATVNSLSKSS
jgi:hypothetical protein